VSGTASRPVYVARGVIHGIQTDRITFMAASLAYYAFISLIPLLLLALVVANAIGGEAFRTLVIEQAEAQLGTAAGEQIGTIIVDQGGQAGASVVATLALIWSGLKLFRGMDVAFSIAYRSALPDGILQQLRDGLISLVAVGGGIVFTVAVGALLAIPQYDLVIGGVSLLGTVGTLLLLTGLTLTFLPLYYILPGTDVSLRGALPGAAFAAIGWTALQTGFRVYAAFAGGDAYGAVGAVILLVTFLYFGGLVLLTGVVLNAVLAGRVDPNETTTTGIGKGETVGAGIEAESETTSNTTGSLMNDDTTLETDLAGEQYDSDDGRTEDDLEAEVRQLRRQLQEFEESVEDRTVHRDDLEQDLRRYVRSRLRRGKARGWGPYLVLLYGTAMTLGAFYFLDSGLWAVLAMIVIWLSTLGLYAVFVGVGVALNAADVPGRILDRVRQFRN